MAGAAVGAVVTAAHAAPAPMPSNAPMGLALNSDACVHPQSGDLLGTGIGILRLNRGHEVYFFYQDVEGEWLEPQIIQLHRGEGGPLGSKISFEVRWGGEKDSFCWSDQAPGGTFRSSTPLLLTRYSADSPLIAIATNPPDEPGCKPYPPLSKR
jgi:hypothetical protein